MSHPPEFAHIRRPDLPWRAAQKTECGLPLAAHPVVSLDEAKARIRDLGKVRAAFVLCMTCAETVNRWKPFDSDPVQAIERECSRNYGRTADDLFRCELLALAELSRRHKEDFDALVESYRTAPTIDEWKNKRRAARFTSVPR